MTGRRRQGVARRLFFALFPDEAARGALGRVARWCRHRSGGREVPDENLHLTLLFLGEINAYQAQLAERAGAAATVPPCRITLERVEYWPGAGLLAAVPAAPLPALERTVRELRADLGAQLPLGREPFVPHVTLVRRVEVLAAVPISSIEWTVEGFALVESRRGASGTPRYEPVAAWPAR